MLYDKENDDYMSDVYLSLDFEIRGGAWWTCAVVLVEHPSQRILRTLTVGHDDDDQQIPDRRNDQFWKSHPLAYAQNLLIGRGETPRRGDAEKVLCEFILRAKRDYPRFYAVSDNPVTDVGILDRILADNGHAPLSQRTENGLYLQCICIWSFRTSLFQVTHLRPGGPRKGTAHDPVSGFAKHHPFYDAMENIRHYFELKELAARL